MSEEKQVAGRNAILRQGNKLKLGLFGANVSSARSYIIAPERWDMSWENNVKLAQVADEAGLECMVPIARWKGYGGESNPNGSSWESITWACGLLAATKRINVFATVHVPSTIRLSQPSKWLRPTTSARAIRHQRCLRLERRRISDVRRYQEGAREPLRAGYRVVEHRQRHLGGRRSIRLRRRALPSPGRGGLAAALRR